MNFDSEYNSKRLRLIDISCNIWNTLEDDELLQFYQDLGMIIRIEDSLYDGIMVAVVMNSSFELVGEGEEIPHYTADVDDSNVLKLLKVRD